VPDRFRCSVAAAPEPLAGTAPTDLAYLLVEYPGPWGRKALAESRLPEPVRTELADHAAKAGVRVQLIRRHRRPAPRTGFRIFAVYADPKAPWAETAVLDQPERLLELDLAALAAGRSPGLDPHLDPLLLVCTNGRRDACCAELGRPLVSALDEAWPEETWETTHLGGHRFAGALLALPYGLSYGRVTAEAGLEIAKRTHRGEVETAHLRGRTAYAGAVQAAEIALLEQLGERRIEALVLVGVQREDGVTTVTFQHGVREHVLTVTEVPGQSIQQSCADLKLKPTVSYVVADGSEPSVLK